MNISLKNFHIEVDRIVRKYNMINSLPLQLKTLRLKILPHSSTDGYGQSAGSSRVYLTFVVSFVQPFQTIIGVKQGCVFFHILYALVTDERGVAETMCVKCVEQDLPFPWRTPSAG